MQSKKTCLLVLGLTCFVFSNQVVWFFVEIRSFCFCLVNFDCGAYLAVDRSLAYTFLKMFLLFSRLILGLILASKPSFSIHISVLLYFFGSTSLHETRKANGFKSPRIKYWEINQATSKCQTDFWTKRAKKV